MSATIIDGGPAGPDEAGGQYRNRILTDRAAWWQAVGARQGVVRGFTHSTVGGQMVLELSPGLALVEERDALGALGSNRGYVVWSDATVTASFGPASASARNDAVVIAFVDVAAGAAALGTETTVVGGQVVVVPGVSGTTAPRTDAEIQAAVGSGGWVRYADVAIPAGSTEIAAGNVVKALVSAGKDRARLDRTTNQNFTNNTITQVSFPTTTYDVGGLKSGDALVIKRDGLYTIMGHTTWVSDFNGSRRIYLRRNGATEVEVSYLSVGAAGLVASWEGLLVAGDSITLHAMQNSGVTLAVNKAWLTARELES